MGADGLKMTYAERVERCRNRAGKKLLKLMEEKKTNLSAGFDVSHSEELLRFTEKVGPEIAIFKTHIDMLEDFTPNVIGELQDLATKHNFLLFEDRKFADIGNTVKLQYGKGIYHISEWADFVNAHSVAGPGVVKGLYEAAVEIKEPRGCFLLAQMTPQGNLAEGRYTRKTVEMGNEAQEFVCGYIGAGSDEGKVMELREMALPGMIIFAPGVQIGKEGDHLGQMYNTPEIAVRAGADVIFTGRGISNAANVQEAAKQYRALGWESYIARTAK